MDIKIKVLLVDDETFILNQIKNIVAWEKFGFEVIGCCANAMDALDCMINEMPDILITDIKMPVMNGLELIKKTKCMNPAIECVVLSGYAEFEFAQTAMEQGVKHYLLKPFSKKAFETTLEKCKEQILNQRQKKTMNLDERTKVVEKLALELKNLKENDHDVEEKAVQELMRNYSDLSLLHSALIYLVAHSLGNNHSLLECVYRLFDAERDIYETTTYTLNDLLCEPDRENSIIGKIKEYTNQHYHEENLTLQTIADNVVHWGVKYTGRRFLQETGEKYSAYLLRIRMEHAKELMKNQKEISVEYVAEQIGLGHDVPYFYQLFKRYVGMTPKEYKKEIGNMTENTFS